MTGLPLPYLSTVTAQLEAGGVPIFLLGLVFFSTDFHELVL